MKPDWDKLMDEFKGSSTGLVADVDCTTEGKSLCEEHGVRGYPSIKWGDPSALEDYEGGRSFEDLQTFAKENLKPVCSPTNLDLCDDEKKKEIGELQALSADDLEKKIEEKKQLIKDAEEAFSTGLKGLQETYEKLQKDKDEGIKQIKDSGLALMQAVAAHLAKPKEEL